MALRAYWSARLRMNPLGVSVSIVLLLPDWYSLFQCIDQPATGVEGLSPMRRTDGDSNADIAQFQMPGSVTDPDMNHSKPLARFFFQVLHRLHRHARIRLIVQRSGLDTAGEFPDGSQKQHHRSRAMIANGFGQLCIVDGFFGQLIHSPASSSGSNRQANAEFSLSSSPTGKALTSNLFCACAIRNRLNNSREQLTTRGGGIVVHGCA